MTIGKPETICGHEREHPFNDSNGAEELGENQPGGREQK
jgi:hypothetical protein